MKNIRRRRRRRLRIVCTVVELSLFISFLSFTKQKQNKNRGGGPTISSRLFIVNALMHFVTQLSIRIEFIITRN